MLDPVQMAVLLGRLNAVFPKFEADELKAGILSFEYRQALASYPADAVDGAVSMWIKDGTRFPAPSQLAGLARKWLEHNRPQVFLPTLRAVDGNHCPCGCGGLRWCVPLTFTSRDGAVTEATRDRMECRTVGLSPLPPKSQFLFLDDRGVPVYTKDPVMPTRAELSA